MNTHEWRWRESNPRPPASQLAFSERSRSLDLGTGAAIGKFAIPQPAKCPQRPTDMTVRVSPAR